MGFWFGEFAEKRGGLSIAKNLFSLLQSLMGLSIAENLFSLLQSLMGLSIGKKPF
jgi:hypothetical protein